RIFLILIDGRSHPDCRATGSRTAGLGDRPSCASSPVLAARRGSLAESLEVERQREQAGFEFGIERLVDGTGAGDPALAGEMGGHHGEPVMTSRDPFRVTAVLGAMGVAGVHVTVALEDEINGRKPSCHDGLHPVNTGSHGWNVRCSVMVAKSGAKGGDGPAYFRKSPPANTRKSGRSTPSKFAMTAGLKSDRKAI
ncbi:hypothetical protein, partial [Acidiphilium sp.]|uniref:hypothetical protein n=1 Tax=Acidiphilium sp. TaxID=527 RepID=UPI003CFD5A7D